ncbi:hypothetical protein QBC39DRAFT_368545 [Podospora conica]|nr:hypothetical protein QBC39DRAFT_368545 [Schizothecium conicum]
MASYAKRPASALSSEIRQTYRILCKASLAAQKTTEPTLQFTPADIPPATLWENVLGLAPQDLTVADLDGAAKTYCAVATKGTSTWKGTLERDHGLDLYTLHYTAILLLTGPMGPYWHLGAHMLRTASDLDYAPSTMSLIRLVLRTTSVGPESSKYKTAMHGPLTKFRLLVQQGRNPDALTIDGALRLRRGDTGGALESFNRAIKVAAAGDPGAFAPTPTQEELKYDSVVPPPPVRKPAWAMESMCHLERGRLLLRKGNREAAEAAFRVAATELDMAAAYLELGKMLPTTSPEREKCLLRAVLTGKTEAIPLLSMFNKSHEAPHPALASSDPEDDERWANEWRLLASGSEEGGKISGFPEPAS